MTDPDGAEESPAQPQRNLDRLKKKRRAHRGQLTKLLSKADNLIQMDTLTDQEVDSLQATLKMITEKLSLLEKLDTEMTDLCTDDELEAMIVEADDYSTPIKEKHAHLSKSLERKLASSQGTQDSASAHNNSFTSAASSNGRQQNMHKRLNLPKLELTKFDGNLLQWQTFFDSFTSAIDKDDTLENIHKFQYLKANLTGEAYRTIEGLTLTENNYNAALDLLRRRYGQPHKITNAYMRALWQLPKPNTEVTSLRKFHDTLESYIRGLNALGKTEDTYGDLLIPIILDKIPNTTRRIITRENGSDEWTLSEIRQAILKEIEAIEAGNIQNVDMQEDNPSSPFQATANFHVGTGATPKNDRKSRPCIFCKGNHPSRSCGIITEPTKRLEIVKRDKLCFNCLGRHKVSDCKSKHRCQSCQRKHHTSLCNKNVAEKSSPTETPQNERKSDNDTNTSQSGSIHAGYTAASEPTSVLLKTALAHVCSPTGRDKLTTYVLFDEGAQRSFVTQDLVNELQLTITPEQTRINTFGAKSADCQSIGKTRIKLKTKDDNDVEISALVVPKITTPMRNLLTKPLKDLPYLNGLELAHPVSNLDTFPIHILIGADYYWSLVGNHIIRGRGPTAVSSKLGYLLSGPIQQSDSYTDSPTTLFISTDSKLDLEENIRRFWDLESIGIKDTRDEPTNYLDNYQDTCLTLEDGKYTAKLPWRDNHLPLPTNYNVCELRTRAMIRRLPTEVRETYNDIIEEQLKRGFIEPVPDDDLNKGHYLPHHPVKKDSSTTPIRIVYDASCKASSHEPSLNSCLETGTPLLNDLVNILLRFRLHQVAISTDIEKAFLNIRLHEDDRDYTKFLWLTDIRDPESDFKTLRFKSVLFGAVCSPFILNATIKTHLDNSESPVTEDLKQNIYVDNVVTGCNTDKEAAEYYQEAKSIMQDCGFKLRSWASNSKELMEQAIKDNVAETGNKVNVLGVAWDTVTDKLGYQTAKQLCQPVTHLTTKRNVLQDISRIFDPLGLISPVHVKAKIFMQELWKSKVEWDEPLNETLLNQWREISNNLDMATEITTQRKYFDDFQNTQNAELHVFADSSTKAYGSVAYLKYNGQTSLVIAKTRVAPLKTITLPKLELMAALTAANLAEFVTKALNNVKITKRIIWSDSQIVIHWICGGKKLPTFIQNRVNDIRKAACEIKYCRTFDNPADLITRGINAKELSASELWWSGPKWLSQNEDWPISDLYDSSVLIAKEDTYSNGDQDTVNKGDQTLTDTEKQELGIHKVININRFSSLQKLLRVTALVKTFIMRMKDKQTNKQYVLSAKDIKQAETLWIKSVQEISYSREIKALKANNNKLGPLVRQLKLFVDNDGLIKCGGRLHNTGMQYNSQFPILLPRHTKFTDLIIQDAHIKVMHAGTGSTMTHIRQRFWIVKCRQTVKTLLRKCVTCRKVTGRPYSRPVAPPLPKCRVTEAPPFTITGVDFTGALNIQPTSRDGGNKAYICLFTCAVTRSIHLEVVPDLSTTSFLHAFRRFCARRSLPQKLISDNATTYLSAGEEIKTLIEHPKIQEYLANRRVDWEYIPKRAPWFGGFWERLIGITKNTLKKVLGHSCVTLTELTTVVTEIEATLNDRPLTYISSSVDEPEPLTPSLLLNGRNLTTMPHSPETDELTDPSYNVNRTNLNKRAILLSKLQEDFWTRWTNEYLPALRENFNPTGTLQNVIKQGDIVLIHDDNKPRMQWNLAKVEALQHGKDGLTRSANIKTCKGFTNRPITKLYPLEICSETETDNPTKPETDNAKSKRIPRQSAMWAKDRIKLCYL